MSEETIITLQYPVTYTAAKIDGGGEHTVDAVRLPARLKARHMEAMDGAKGEMGQMLALVVAVTGLPRDAVRELDAEDFGTIMEALEAPLKKRLGTGPTSSD